MIGQALVTPTVEGGGVKSVEANGYTLIAAIGSRAAVNLRSSHLGGWHGAAVRGFSSKEIGLSLKSSAEARRSRTAL